MKVSLRLPYQDRRVPFSVVPQWIVPCHFGRRWLFGWRFAWKDVTLRWLSVDVRFQMITFKKLPGFLYPIDWN